MSYTGAVIGDNPQNYWRLNEGPGATVALDHGNSPGNLWLGYTQVPGYAARGVSGAGFTGITADGGAWNSGAGQLWNRVPPPSTVTTPYVPLPNNGTLEAWYFLDEVDAGVYVGWLAPNAAAGQQLFGMVATHNTLTADVLSQASVLVTVSPLSQWHHIAMTWSAEVGRLFLDGVQVATPGIPTPVGGGRVHFFVGDNRTDPIALGIAGIVSEVAVYPMPLSGSQLQNHISQAELRGTRPGWKVTTSGGGGDGGGFTPNYSLGVTHIGLTGSSVLQVPTGLKGILAHITSGIPTIPTLPGQPPYYWDVGWMTISDANGMLEQRRITRERQIWLSDVFAIGDAFGFFLNPGFTCNFTELDPA